MTTIAIIAAAGLLGHLLGLALRAWVYQNTPESICREYRHKCLALLAQRQANPNR